VSCSLPDATPENAAALVAAGMLSVLFFPAVAFALRRRSARSVEPEPFAG
jgi:hypothetical protein